MMEELLNSKDAIVIPKEGDLIKGKVVAVTKNEIYIDIPGVTGGLVRGRELRDETGVLTKLQVGDEVTATVIDQENEQGLIELSLRSASHQQAWQSLTDLKQSQAVLEVKILEANKGGLLVNFNGQTGFMPVSQLNKEHYPRVEGGNKSKILEKLKQLVGKTLKAKVIDLEEGEGKIIFSEKEVYADDKKVELAKYKVGDTVECVITGLVDFGVFVEFGAGLEGLIHISELAWQRIEHPRDIFKVKDKIQAQIIGIEGERVTLSAKRLLIDPWKKVSEKYKIGDVVEGKVLKIDKFGVFVELDQDIHGLAHISELSDGLVEKPEEVVEVGQSYQFKILSIEPEEHRLGLTRKGLEELRR